jgi:DNA-directed RNA polymerase subunit RPC12/RpoP
LTDQEYQSLDKDTQSVEKSLQIKKYKIHHTLMYPRDDLGKGYKFYQEWDNPKKQTSVYNLRKLFSIRRGVGCELYQEQTKDVIDRLMNGKEDDIQREVDFNYQKKHVTKNDVVVLETLFEMLTELGFDNIPCFDGVDKNVFNDKVMTMYQRYTVKDINKVRTALFKSKLKHDDKKYNEIKKNTKSFKEWIDKLIQEYLSIQFQYEQSKVYLKCTVHGMTLCDPNKFRLLDIHTIEKDELFVHRYDGFFGEDWDKEYCEYCNNLYSNRVYWTSHIFSKKHLKNVEKGIVEYKYRCECKMGFHSQLEYGKHACGCSSNRDDCPFCDVDCGEENVVKNRKGDECINLEWWLEHFKECSGREKVEEVVEEVVEEKVGWKCEKCLKEFEYKSKLDEHMETCGKEKEKVVYRCIRCKKDFGNHRGHYERHINRTIPCKDVRIKVQRKV